jgi:hypothetical protein
MKVLNIFIATAILSTAFLSCKKSAEDAPAPAAVGAAGSFTWTENGGAVITADSAFWTTYNGGTGIRAYKGANLANFFEINWAGNSNTAVGAKTLNTTGDFTFVKLPIYYINPTNQLLNISAFANNKITGNATVAVTGGTITTLALTFTELPKK